LMWAILGSRCHDWSSYIANAPVEVATPKLELVTCVKKWMSRIADGVDSVWTMWLREVSTETVHAQSIT
jgi:hypothetical protein